MSTHTHTPLVAASADPDLRNGMAVFAWGSGRSRRTAYGQFTDTGLVMWAHDDDDECPNNSAIGATPGGTNGLVQMAAAGAGARQCDYLTEVHAWTLRLAQEAADPALETVLAANPTVRVIEGVVPKRPELDELKWVWTQADKWRPNPKNGLLDLTYEWPSFDHLPDDVQDRLRKRIPAVDPHYVPNRDQVAAAMYGVFGQSWEGGGRNWVLRGGAGSGKDALVRHIAATVGAPLVEVTAHANMTESQLLYADTLQQGSGTVRKAVLAEWLDLPVMFNLKEANRMAEISTLLEVMERGPGQPIILSGSQGEVEVTRHEDFVFCMTQNQGAKHRATFDQGPAHGRRVFTQFMSISPAQFELATRARLEAILADARLAPGVDPDLVEERATHALEQVWLPLALAARCNEDIVDAIDVSPVVVAAAAHATPFLGYGPALVGKIAGQTSDPTVTATIVEWAKEEHEVFNDFELSDADL